jgi:CheY-like chemotaxis protein
LVARVLLVDDNPDERLIYSSILLHHGHHVDEAGDAISALELARNSSPDIILMDVHLPIMNGLLATEILRELPETTRIPVICLTGYDVSAQDADAAGCVRLLRKPVDPKRLVEAVDSVLRSHPSARH